MAGWLHGVSVGDWLFVFPLCGFSLSLFCNYQGMVECQRRGDIMAVLPRLESAAVDVVVAHASAKSFAAEAAKTAGWTAARAERTKRTQFRKDVPDHAAFPFVLSAVETCGCMGKEVVEFVDRLGDIAAESGRTH